jgi:ADP-L-glycero-D-manno-heptose 6-epimerase
MGSSAAMSTLENGRILVTGGAGFIGSAVIWALNRRGLRDIVVADFLAPGKRWRDAVPLDGDLAAKRRNLAPLRFADLLEADELRARLATDPDALGRVGTVFHLGACSSTTEQNEAFLMDNNVAFTRELAEWALGRGARFIYASSAATYGDGSAGMEDGDAALDRLRPLNRYGWSKHRFDLHARDAGYLHRIAGLKYFNVFGPNEDHKGDMRSVVHKAFHQIRDSGRVRLFRSYRPEYPDGGQRRDFLYVKDAVEMTLHFAETAPEAGGLFNLGSGVAHTWLELADALFAAMRVPPAIEFIDMPAELRERYQYYTRADIGRLRGSGYTRPPTPLADAVRDYVEHHLQPAKRLGE